MVAPSAPWDPRAPLIVSKPVDTSTARFNGCLVNVYSRGSVQHGVPCKERDCSRYCAAQITSSGGTASCGSGCSIQLPTNKVCGQNGLFFNNTLPADCPVLQMKCGMDNCIFTRDPSGAPGDTKLKISYPDICNYLTTPNANLSAADGDSWKAPEKKGCQVKLAHQLVGPMLSFGCLVALLGILNMFGLCGLCTDSCKAGARPCPTPLTFMALYWVCMMAAMVTWLSQGHNFFKNVFNKTGGNIGRPMSRWNTRWTEPCEVHAQPARTRRHRLARRTLLHSCTWLEFQVRCGVLRDPGVRGAQLHQHRHRRRMCDAGFVCGRQSRDA